MVYWAPFQGPKSVLIRVSIAWTHSFVYVSQAVPGPGKYEIKSQFSAKPIAISQLDEPIVHPPFGTQSRVRHKHSQYLNEEAAWLSGQGTSLKSGDCQFKILFLTSARLEPGFLWFNSSAALVCSQLVCLLPVGILNLLGSFVVFCCYLYSNSTSVHGCHLPTNLSNKVLLLLLLMWLNAIQAKLKSSQCWSVVSADRVPLFEIWVFTKLQMTHIRSGRSCNFELQIMHLCVILPLSFSPSWLSLVSIDVGIKVSTVSFSV